jgi:hypothetical protein
MDRYFIFRDFCCKQKWLAYSTQGPPSFFGLANCHLPLAKCFVVKYLPRQFRLGGPVFVLKDADGTAKS